MSILTSLTDTQLRSLRTAQLTAQANALKQAAFLETGLTDTFSTIDAQFAAKLALIPNMTRAQLEALTSI